MSETQDSSRESGSEGGGGWDTAIGGWIEKQAASRIEATGTGIKETLLSPIRAIGSVLTGTRDLLKGLFTPIKGLGNIIGDISHLDLIGATARAVNIVPDTIRATLNGLGIEAKGAFKPIFDIAHGARSAMNAVLGPILGKKILTNTVSWDSNGTAAAAH